ncbi:unnamed protein product [Toxocara canis]|uniref:ABC transmembrane type-1 domain-containing protein n=1 Tax=Toxocara canis TaxID=6265 RepID=A0A183UEV2_TOXCA|nr:unnamed protein product [Toxocara canis]
MVHNSKVHNELPPPLPARERKFAAIPLPDEMLGNDDEGDGPPQTYEPSRAEKIINIMLCRIRTQHQKYCKNLHKEPCRRLTYKTTLTVDMCIDKVLIMSFIDCIDVYEIALTMNTMKLYFRRDLANQKLATKPVSISELFRLQFRFAQRFDIFLVSMGTLCAIISGIAQPILALVSGKAVNVLLVVDPRAENFREQAYQNVYKFVGIGSLVLIMNYAQYMCFQTTCCRIIAKLRHNYLRSILRQNAGWLDRNQSGELSTGLNNNIERIREGIGDKLGLLIRGFAMFTTGMIVAFIVEWRVALLMFPVTPISCFIMAQLSQQMGATTRKELIGVAKAGAIAEESVLGVRTVQAFNGQNEMVRRYETELSRGKTFGVQKGLWSGFLHGLFFLALLIFLGSGML